MFTRRFLLLAGLGAASAFAPASLGGAPKLGLRSSSRAVSRQGRAAVPSMKWGDDLSDDGYLIAPSILSADFAKLGEEVDNMLAAGADVVHFDVMDNHYVPNLTIGPGVCKALRDHGVTAPIDVHLMVDPVDRIIGDFIDAGASYITFHPEASNHVDRSLQLIRDGGCKSGLVFTPATSLEYAKYVLDKVDIILLMSVNPGFGGQKFIEGTLDKAREARKMIDESGYDIRLEIDGGVGEANIKKVAEAGVDMFVAGSAILKAPREQAAYKKTIDNMRAELAKAKVTK
jgi:ribulose-phosphate 3-epimerase